MGTLERHSTRVACPKGISIGGDFPGRYEIEVPASLVQAGAGVSNVLKKRSIDILVLPCKAM